MSDLKSVNPFTLPSVPLQMRSQLPQVQSVYLVLAAKKILYIGRASNLRQRWRQHQHLKKLEDISAVQIAWIEEKDRAALFKLELDLIEKYKPIYNQTTGRISKRQKSGYLTPQEAFNLTLKTFDIKASELSKISGHSMSYISQYRNGSKDIYSTALVEMIRLLPAGAQYFFLSLILMPPEASPNLGNFLEKLKAQK